MSALFTDESEIDILPWQTLTKMGIVMISQIVFSGQAEWPGRRIGNRVDGVTS
jgi:hypothetical protein